MQMQLKTGAAIGNYLLLDSLGQGGLNEVFLAKDQLNNRLVVLKFPNRATLDDPVTYERFRREVEAGQTLDHPDIQKLYELAGSKYAPFLVLQYLEGQTLRDYLNSLETVLPEEKAIAFGLQIAHTLEYIHSKNIYHRDLKPENIIITPEGEAKIMDFGSVLIEGARRVTWGRAFSMQVGTPKYMSPEQAIGKRGDAHSDIYALGTIIYEMLAGRTPYRGDNPIEVMNQHLAAKLPLISDFNSDVDPNLEEVVLKAMRRDPAKRWQTMAQFADALAQPQTIEVEELAAERKSEEDKTVDKKYLVSPNNELGIPYWQVGLIILTIFVVLIAIGVVIQLLHH